MWPALLFCSSASGLALGLARLKVWPLIPATIILALIAGVSGVMSGLHWGSTAVMVFATAAILQFSYVIVGLLSEVEAPSPRVAPRASLRLDLIRAAQFAIGEELRIQFQTPPVMPSQLRTRMKQLAIRYA